MSTRSVWPTASVIPERTNFWNPVTSVETTYSPMGILGAAYSPAVFVASSRVKPFSGFQTVTLALGITPPEESVTVPTIVAVSCAQAEKQRKTNDATSKHGVFTVVPPAH